MVILVKKKKIIVILIVIISLICLVISIYHIINWKKDSMEISKQVKEIKQAVQITEKEDNENTELIEPEEPIPEFNPYWDYIKMNLLDVNFNELKNTNDAVAGWIKVNGTNINYPYVHTTDNSYYLTHSFNKSYNSAGWVFLDYRNSKYELAKNNIIYAHGRLDNSMFGSLRKILTNGWLNDTNNHVIHISTETENTLWQVFSVYRIPTTNDYIQIDFQNDNEFINFGKKLVERSVYNFNTAINANDNILTLSTCYDDNDKVVLHAKLIKREKKG